MSQASSAVTPTARRTDWRFLLPVERSFKFDKVVLVDANGDLVEAFRQHRPDGDVGGTDDCAQRSRHTIDMVGSRSTPVSR